MRTVGRNNPMVIAHRGASALAQHENTLEAFQTAIDLKADMAEFDVRRTSDDVLIVFHDRTFGGNRISDMTYNRINELAARENYRVPQLCEVLDFCRGRIRLDIELKESGYEKRVVAMVKEMYGYGEFSIKSFKDRVSYNVKSIDSRIRTGLLVGRKNASFGERLNEYFPMRRLRACGADFISPHYLLCTGGFIHRMKRSGVPVYVWTVNDERVMRRLISKGVDAIITDRPDKLSRVQLTLQA